MVDVGIDGQIEFVNDAGKATGQLIAVQVKSGPSYFHDHGDHWWFYPDSKHRYYWERYPLPVIVMLHHPDENITYWADARLALRSPEKASLAHISVPKATQLQSTSRDKLFVSVGASGAQVLPIPEVLKVYLISASLHRGFDRSVNLRFTSLRWQHGRARVSRLPGTLQTGCRTHGPGR
jgi:hypothetical protein